MKTFTYANEYTVKGNIMDETETFYIVEFEASPGFMDTVTFEKELTVVTEEIELTELVTATFKYTVEKTEEKVVVKRFNKEDGQLERIFNLPNNGRQSELLAISSKRKLPKKLLEMVR